MAPGTSPHDLYAVLGVAPDASADELKRAYRVRARELHPDAGGDPEAFKALVDAWDVLRDPAARARYDRRGQRRASPFYGSHWGSVRPDAPPPSTPPPSRDLDLEDIFNDFGGVGQFGFGGRPASQGPRVNPGSPPPQAPPRASAPPPRATPPPPRRAHVDGAGTVPPPEGAGARVPPATPVPGSDAQVRVDVPADVAEHGGSVLVAYRRLRRDEDGVGISITEEIHDLRVPPGTQDGEVLRVPRLGNASLGVGQVGELAATVRIVGAAGSGRVRMPPREGAPPPVVPPPGAAAASARGETVLPVRVGVAEALLGGRVPFDTPTGRVTLAVPAGTSGGTRLRVRGRGLNGADVLADVQIVVPRELDAESRRLIERFAALNPSVTTE